MKLFNIIMMIFPILIYESDLIYSQKLIPADNPYIQYFGRWDMADSLHPKQSWPGVYIYAGFSGRSIGIRLDDNVNYYNVCIDGKLYPVFHGDKTGDADYLLADSLTNTNHTLLFSKRNISFNRAFTFSGLILEEGANLLPPPPKPARKMEFIGDSFTAAEGNEAKLAEMPWEEKFPVTNIDKGFAADVAKYFNAQFVTTCRSGIGLVCDWQGKYDAPMPKLFDRTLMEFPEPKWDFKKYQPDIVVVCIGLNDHSGLKDKSGAVSDENSLLFRKEYHEFLKMIRGYYPSVKIIAVAAHDPWIQTNVKRVVDDEVKDGCRDLFFAKFDRFEGGYVANGHPNVESHKKIAYEIIKVIEVNHLFQ
jgi:Carbohydrate esterase 2 N-terminal/GDSL-like Lipase/Acylhydrolase family